jgi:hypothetical protein
MRKFSEQLEVVLALHRVKDEFGSFSDRDLTFPCWNREV